MSARRRQRSPRLSVVIPVYQSRCSLAPLTDRLTEVFERAGIEGEIILVNDGSTDGSWEEIARLCSGEPRIRGIDLRRNFGQDNAIMAGLRFARGGYVAVMDDDLQHDPQDLPRLLDAIEAGPDVVYAAFENRHAAVWKRFGSWVNGKTAELTIGKPKGIYLSPYKIIRGDLLDTLLQYDGPYPYVDGMLFQVTSRIAQIPATHHPRAHGEGNYSLARSLRVWVRLFSSFSVRPLRLVMWLGLLVAAVGAAGACLTLYWRLAHPEAFGPEAAGWASLMLAILLLGGAQMVFLGVMGEYIGRTYLRVNHKPQAVVRTVINAEGEQR